MNTVILRPAPGCFVRDPETRVALAADGEPKVLDLFWRRRIAAGDVVIDEPTAADPPVSKDLGRVAGRTSGDPEKGGSAKGSAAPASAGAVPRAITKVEE